MAPQTKREAEDANEEVCKRLKEEIKNAGDADKSETPPNKTKESDKSNHSNNNDHNVDNNNKNKTDAGEDKAVPDTKSTSDTNGNAEGSATNASKETEDKKTVTSSEKNKDDEKAGDEKPAEANAKQATASKSDKHDKSDKESIVNGGQKSESVKSESGKSTTSGAATTPKDTAKTEAQEEDESEENEGTFVMCGGANWDMTGRKELPKAAKKPAQVNPAARNLWGPHVVTFDGKPLRVKGVYSGSNACHSVIVTVDGDVMTFGRNDKGQLGLGDTETRVTPTVITAFKGIDIVGASCGRSHTLFLDSEGIVYACGDNKMGQCGTNQQSVHTLTSPARILFKENKPIVKVACGAEFSMILDEDGRLYSFGHPEYGQLGHNFEGKYFTSGNKYAFHCEYAPRRIMTYIEKNREGHVMPVDDVEIIDVACGTNHTLAVDKHNRCYSWGFAGYHRLGHSETKNELVPRSIKLFDAPKSTGRGAARVWAGAQHSLALDLNGLLYFWGQNKSSGEATMYPKNVQDLCGCKIKDCSSGNRSIFVITEDICVSWGPSPTYGELGYGEGKSKSSTTPQEVKTLDGLTCTTVACGFGHTMLIARDSKPQDEAALKKIQQWP